MFIILFGVVLSTLSENERFQAAECKTAQRHIDIRAEVDIICIK